MGQPFVSGGGLSLRPRRWAGGGGWRMASGGGWGERKWRWEPSTVSWCLCASKGKLCHSRRRGEHWSQSWKRTFSQSCRPTVLSVTDVQSWVCLPPASPPTWPKVDTRCVNQDRAVSYLLKISDLWAQNENLSQRESSPKFNRAISFPGFQKSFG